MAGSKMVIGSMVGGALQAGTYSANGYSQPTLDANTAEGFSGMTFSQAEGVSTLSFTAPLAWLEQFSAAAAGGRARRLSSQVSVVAARGSGGNTLSYHGATKRVSVVESFRAPTQSNFCTQYVATCSSIANAAPYPDCNSAIDTMSTGTPGSSEAGDTLSCREYHLGVAMSSAENAAIHCAHAAPDGGGVCVNSSPPPPIDFCAQYQQACDGSSEPYADCQETVASLPAGVPGSTVSGNTLSCRTYHLSVAMMSASNAAVHCPHASPSGGGVCIDPSPPPALELPKESRYPTSSLTGYTSMYSPPNVPNDYTLHWTVRGNKVDMAVTALVPSAVNGWLSVAFSTDGQMVGSSAVMGQPSAGTVKMFNLDGKPPSFRSAQQEPLNNTAITVVDGLITMRFTRATSGRVPIVPSSNTLLLWGFGSAPYGPGSAGYHGRERGRFLVSLSGSDAPLLGGVAFGIDPVDVYKMAHGVLMFLGWGVLLPLGAVTSRFFRHHDPLWFDIHRFLQMSGLLSGFIGWVIALVQFTPFGAMPRLGQAHYTFGMMVMVLGLMQPLNGILRPHKGQPFRKQWEWLHKGSGYTALFLAWPTIFMGAALFAYQVPTSAASDVASGVIWTMVVFLVLITLYCAKGTVFSVKGWTLSTVPLTKEYVGTSENSKGGSPSVDETSAVDKSARAGGDQEIAMSGQV